MLKHHEQQQDEDEEELDVDISKKLLELQQQQKSGQKPQQEEEEEEDEEMMIDLDQLDDQNRELLLEYLKQEYDKNPGQFPFPKELIEDFMKKEQLKKAAAGGEAESVKGINSQEMILEDAAADEQ
jgi:hypothetical protein